nr:MAG TPA: hypothetical protein [Caudoviricetes sp.]
MLYRNTSITDCNVIYEDTPMLSKNVLKRSNSISKHYCHFYSYMSMIALNVSVGAKIYTCCKMCFHI